MMPKMLAIHLILFLGVILGVRGELFNLSRAGLTEFPTNVSANTTILKLNGNEIESLPNDAFVNLTDLTELELKGNRLTDISNVNFTHVEKLIKLELKDNRIRELPALCGELKELHELNIAYNWITSLPGGVFAGCDNLVHITISGNPIDKLWESSFSGLKQRIHLSAGLGDLQSVNKKCLDQMPLAEVIVIKGGKLSTAPCLTPAMSPRTALNVDFSRQEITELDPYCLSGFRSNYHDDILPKLSVWGNRIRTIQNLTRAFSEITQVRLNHNNIDDCLMANQPDIWKSHLKTLDLTRNNLTCFLQIDNPKVRNSLQRLILLRNAIKCVDFQISPYANLKTLNLSRNGLQYFVVDDCSRADRVSVSVRLAFPSLETINLGINDLTVFPNLTGMHALTHVYMGRNNITSLSSEMLLELPELQELALPNNKLTSMLFSDTVLPNLMSLDLRNNSDLEFPDMSSFVWNGMPNIKMTGNKVVCDARVCWIKDPTTQIATATFDGTLPCQGPPEMTGKTWEEVNACDLACTTTLHERQSVGVRGTSGWFVNTHVVFCDVLHLETVEGPPQPNMESCALHCFNRVNCHYFRYENNRCVLLYD